MIPLSTDSEVALDPSDINNISWLNADSFLQKLDNSVSYVQHFYMGYKSIACQHPPPPLPYPPTPKSFVRFLWKGTDNSFYAKEERVTVKVKCRHQQHKIWYPENGF